MLHIFILETWYMDYSESWVADGQYVIIDPQAKTKTIREFGSGACIFKKSVIDEFPGAVYHSSAISKHRGKLEEHTIKHLNTEMQCLLCDLLAA